MEENVLTFYSLHELLQSASSEPSPEVAISNLIDQCVAHTQATSGYLYKLELSRSAYQCVHRTATDAEYPDISVDIVNLPELADTLVEEVIASCLPKMIYKLDQAPKKYVGSPETSSAMLMPIVRSESTGAICLGVLVLEFHKEKLFPQPAQEFVASVASALLLLFEKNYMLVLLRNAQKPLNFRKPRDEFMDDVVLLISKSSGMPYVVLREHVDMSLRCVAQSGFDEEKEALDIEDVRLCETFAWVIENKKPRAEVNIEAEHLGYVRSRPELQKIRSFVVAPVNVGGDIFGTLSFGCSCSYPFIPLEITALECIANAIGVAIENQRNFHKHDADLFIATQNGTAFTAVEVAQAARHEGRNHLDFAIGRLTLMLGQVENPSRENLNKLVENIRKIGEALVSTGQTLEKIKSISKPPQRELRLKKLKEAWDEAFNIVLGRLESENISWRLNGPEVEAEMYPDFLGHAFLNLILNSIDAFRDNSRKSGRLITVTIETPSAAAQDLVMKYTDNAGGIDAYKLIPKLGGEARPVEAIFEVGVTSKESGSGYGLYLVRKILREHHGSIDLINHRGGVQFAITLPKRLSK